MGQQQSLVGGGPGQEKYQLLEDVFTSSGGGDISEEEVVVSNRDLPTASSGMADEAVTEETDDDTVRLIRQNGRHGSGDKAAEQSNGVHIHVPPKASTESFMSITLQILFPFTVAGLGMVGAGIVLDIVQHWKVFEEINELFILVPALLGLKGNLEMTLASRLSTQV